MQPPTSTTFSSTKTGRIDFDIIVSTLHDSQGVLRELYGLQLIELTFELLYLGCRFPAIEGVISSTELNPSTPLNRSCRLSSEHLPLDSQLCITVRFPLSGEAISGSLDLFDLDGRLPSGPRAVFLWRGESALPSPSTKAFEAAGDGRLRGALGDAAGAAASLLPVLDIEIRRVGSVKQVPPPPATTGGVPRNAALDAFLMAAETRRGDSTPDEEQSLRIAAALGQHNLAPLDEETAHLFRRFGRYLTRQPRALVKYILSADWQREDLIDSNLSLIDEWRLPGVDDALFLLSRRFSLGGGDLAPGTVGGRGGPGPQGLDAARRKAREALKRLPSADFCRILPQLCASLRYESTDAPLLQLIADRVADNADAAARVYWLLMVEFSAAQGYSKVLYDRAQMDWLSALMDRKASAGESLLRVNALVAMRAEMAHFVEKTGGANKTEKTVF